MKKDDNISTVSTVLFEYSRSLVMPGLLDKEIA
jgi:hypothetical protein